jgi:hypothetical protein
MMRLRVIAPEFSAEFETEGGVVRHADPQLAGLVGQTDEQARALAA